MIQMALLLTSDFTVVYYILGCTVYLSLGFGVKMPFGQYWYCCLNINILFTAMLCSTILILNMTFDRFYSIVRPHKAASFNTVKRAKITIACAVFVSILFNIPHLFVSMNDGWLCLPFGNRIAMKKWYSQFYYWLSFGVQYAIPFISLLSMNCVIIHTLRNRMNLITRDKNPDQSQRPNSKIKSSEMQIYVILLLVTFGFLILTTPGYLFFLINLVYDFRKSPKIFAGYHLYTNTAQKMHFTNHGINFFLYVISGKKFRTDLKNLFVSKATDLQVSSSSGDVETKVSTVEQSASQSGISKLNSKY